MSKLEFYARPLVKFDPANKQHRKWYYDFLEYRGWGRCPVRFICADDTGMDLTVMIKNHLVEYYVNREFKPRPSPKPRFTKKTKITELAGSIKPRKSQ